jgi:hypothetical protein
MEYNALKQGRDHITLPYLADEDRLRRLVDQSLAAGRQPS